MKMLGFVLAMPFLVVWFVLQGYWSIAKAIWRWMRGGPLVLPECGERTFHCDHFLRREWRPTPECERVAVWIYECCHCKRVKVNWPR